MRLEDTITQLEAIHENFRLLVGSNGTAAGSLRQGHAICSTCPQEAAAETGGQIINTPPTSLMGACCGDCDCTVTTEAECSGTYMEGLTCSPNPCGSDEIRRCCFCGGECSDLTECQCDEMGGMWSGPATTCSGCSGGTPCCTSKHGIGHITGTITYDDGSNPPCTWTIDDTLEFDSFCQDNGCDNEGYPGCCLDLASGNISPVTIDAGTANEHTVSLGFSASDNFDETADVVVAMQIDPFSTNPGCSAATTVPVTCSDLVGVSCNGSQSGTCDNTDSFGATSWSLSFDWSFG